jgi:Protein of unknown function (DUF642)
MKLERRSRLVRGILARSTVAAILVATVAFAAAAFAATASLAAAPKGPNLIKNGTFGIGRTVGDACADIPSQATIAGWTPGSTTDQVCGNLFIQTPNGISQFVSLYLGGEGTITQTVATVPGTTYLLQWYGAAEPTPPGNPPVKTMHVLWNDADVASPTYSSAGETASKMHWTLHQVVVTATSTSSTVQFADDTAGITVGYPSLVTDVILAADASLFLPAKASLAPTGKLTAIVHDGKGAPLTQTGLTVSLTADVKTVSYAPGTEQVIATAPVVNGQAVLKLKLPASAKGQTIKATATLKGPNYIPATRTVTIKVT